MIYTSNYKNIDTKLYKVVSISSDYGLKANYGGKCCYKLVPKYSIWELWEKNQYLTIDEIYNYYIELYYKVVLSKLKVEEVFKDLDNNILLCYGNNNDFSNRHIIAAWLELFLDIDIPEIENGKIVNRGKIYQEIKRILENIIKQNINMHGFNCIRAAYLFEQSEELEEKARKIKGPNSCVYQQEACYLRCDADEAEALYNGKKKTK